MNYIRHLNAFFSLIKTDTRLTASHVSLYMALFQYWNFNRFQNPFSIYRENIMQLSKIGSKNTYHKCIKQLHEAKYIYYHPSANRFHLVRISVIPLYKQEQPPERYKQLGLFSTDNDTNTVPKLGQPGTGFDTVPVSKMGHIIKPNIKQRETPTHEIFKTNKKIQEAINDFAGGDHIPSPSGEGGRHRRTDEADIGGVPKLIPESISEVEEFFQQKNYPATEVTKFYNHYKALGWKLQGKTPILDWKPLVEKWMANARKWELSSAGGGITASSRDGGGKENDLKFLYDSFLEGKKIFHLISPAHFDQLKLRLDEETMKQAWQERINQVSGTNQHSLIELWKAYLTGDPNNLLVTKDRSNLVILAKKISVLNHFMKKNIPN